MKIARELPSCKGIYALIMKYNGPRKNLRVGSGIVLELEQSMVYVYIGSAQGAGGIKARISRHLRKEKRLKWHIDYLTSLKETSILYIVYSCTRDSSAESRLVNTCSSILSGGPNGFGASDDPKNRTHLFLLKPVSGQDYVDILKYCFRIIGFEPDAISASSL